ncbi:unnamed protein product [Rotaria socialis]|uniref:Uncharacterized protein n=1 Tax=Rotaria socialis TaxID=392032 RepID=A0A821QH61_9BILA|nr:unnamed protein product [Rotaria socialis]CAF4330889.1 unnamed protein product [Rotaria socialis]CAF4356040.1 unnamed protein product [Rotaria socialis]CAF4823511.1 unnamed protein product [Rotaria socialis]
MVDEEPPITMLALWGEQRRPISIKINDELSIIESAIIIAFELQQINHLRNYQLQYYDNNRQRFIDLYSGTVHAFQQVLRKLSSPEPPPQSSKEWFLKIILKTITTKHHNSRESITDDTYSYQQENDTTVFSEGEEAYLMASHTSIFTERPVLAGREDFIERSYSTIKLNLDFHNPLDVTKTEIVQHKTVDDNQQDVTQSDALLLPSMTIPAAIIATEKNPYVLGFDCNLSPQQRLQFESDMIRPGTSKKTSMGGVLLRAASKSTASSTDEISYPTVHFEIPGTELHLNWIMFIYILTEADMSGTHYLHASKGIYDNCTKDQDKFGIIENTKLVNPHVVQLSQDELRAGRYSLRLKVCNIKNLPTRKRARLREFPGLNKFLIVNDDNLLSTKTTSDLNFSSEKYHVGCILVHGNTVRDRCISSLTIAPNTRKRTDTDQSNQQMDEYPDKKYRANS